MGEVYKSVKEQEKENEKKFNEGAGAYSETAVVDELLQRERERDNTRKSLRKHLFSVFADAQLRHLL